MVEGPLDALVSVETRVPGLSCDIQYQSVTDTHTDRQTDGHTRRRYVLRLA